MIRSRLLQAWRLRFARREDPALERFSKLKGCGTERPVTVVPVFSARKARLA